MPECYIRGSTIKYLRIPDEVIDMVKEEVLQKSKGRGEMRGRGGPQRGGRGGRGMLCFSLEKTRYSCMILHNLNSIIPVILMIFKSPKQKAQVSFSDHNLSFPCGCRCRLFTFLAHLSQRFFDQNLSVFVVVVIGVVLNYSHFHHLLQNQWANFSQTLHNASLGEGDSILFKWRAHPFLRGDNYEIVKNTLTILKKSSPPEPLGQFQPNLTQSILGWRGFKFVQMKGPALFKGEINTK